MKIMKIDLFSYSAKGSGSSVIFTHFYTQGSAHSKIPQNVAKYRSMLMFFRIATRSILRETKKLGLKKTRTKPNQNQGWKIQRTTAPMAPAPEIFQVTIKNEKEKGKGINSEK